MLRIVKNHLLLNSHLELPLAKLNPKSSFPNKWLLSIVSANKHPKVLITYPLISLVTQKIQHGKSGHKPEILWIANPNTNTTSEKTLM